MGDKIGNSEEMDVGHTLPELTEGDKEFLKEIARRAVVDHITGNPSEELNYTSPALDCRCGAFVTLKVGGQLRGCIGTIYSPSPIPETIQEMAVKSATGDPRFNSIEPEELKDLSVEISILGPLIEVKNTNDIAIGRDGLVIEKGGRHGLLLPQVAKEHKFDTETFLRQTCLKASLPPDAWRHGAHVYRFEAIVF